MARPLLHRSSFLLVTAGGLIGLLHACGGEPPPPTATTTASGVTITELALGSGEPFTDGDYAALHYDARIARIGDANGEAAPYDSTRGGEPFLCKLGTTHLLPGFAEGIEGMQSGGRRRLLLPPATAHGAAGRGRVPPDAWLEYEVELVARFIHGSDGVQYRVLAEGRGDSPTTGDHVAIEQRSYTLESGRLLSDSRQVGTTHGFKLGAPEVIPGLDATLRQMKPTARWQVALPPTLAFGTLGTGGHLLPGQDLLMEVELLRVERR